MVIFMCKFSLTTAFVSLLLLYNVDAFAVDNLAKANTNDNKITVNTKKNHSDMKRVVLRKLAKGYHRIELGGQILSYAWCTDNVNQSQKHGVGVSGILNVKSVSENPNLGISYGASLQIGVPAIKDKYFIPTVKAYNRGAQLFIDSSYGNISMGYQEGVDSIMKIDAFTIGSGDNSITWVQNLNILDKDKNLVYHVFPGLYTESLFNGSESLALLSIQGRGKDFINNLPFRISYQSPSFAGLKVAVSYAPLGYPTSLFEHADRDDYKVDKLTIPPLLGPLQEKTADKKIEEIVAVLGDKIALQDVEMEGLADSGKVKFLGPNYKNIINAGLSYSHSFDSIDFQASVIAEYASNDVEALKKSSYSGPLVPFNGLSGIAVGTSVAYDSVIVAASYGYLGKSGQPINVKGNAYYWTLGAKYTYDNASISTSYFRSNNFGNEFQDFGIGIDCNLSANSKYKGQYKVFGNYHRFNVKNISSTSSGSYAGNVLLLGMKYEF
ncbi:porin [Ehrlichia ruminantium]|nr:porin [Ehrlichia ruminantium]QLK51502.1 porin [Ehrlichia ruminantium]QLK52426.1 porin [Ehrlichia ruminantium]QLK54256.1 porin [Ehrlichia ruminantium]QLK57008.1 porin [Ehrlichia ruminantium]